MDTADIRERLARIEENLKAHMKRSDLLEENQEAYIQTLRDIVTAVRILEARIKVWIAVGAGVVPMIAVAVSVWKAFH